jgi:hypothetical protein
VNMTPRSEGRMSVRPLESAISMLQLDVDRRVEDEGMGGKSGASSDGCSGSRPSPMRDLQGHQSLGAEGPIATSSRSALGLE